MPCAVAPTLCTKSSCISGVSSGHDSDAISERPMSTARGVRRSWDSIPTRSETALLAAESSAFVRSSVSALARSTSRASSATRQ